MSNCILCLCKLKKGKSVKLSDPVCDSFTLGDAIRQQIQSNILQPYSKSSSQQTCKTCHNSFITFFKFLTKVQSNLSSFKSENSFEIAPDSQQIYVPPNVLMLKMEPQVLLPRIKVEPDLMLDYGNLVNENLKVDEDDANLDNLNQDFEENIYKFNENQNNFNRNLNNVIESTKKLEKNDDIDRFSDDSDFAWSYDDPMDSLDDNDNGGMDVDDWSAPVVVKAKDHPKTVHNDAKTRKSTKNPNKTSRKSEKIGENSDIKLEDSDNELDNSEVKLEISDDEVPLSNRKFDKSVQKSSRITRKSIKSSSKSNKNSSPQKSTQKTRRSRSLRSKLNASAPDSQIPPESNKKSIKSELDELESSANPENQSKANEEDLKPSIPVLDGPLPLLPAKSSSGYIRYLPRDQITLEMVNSGQLYVVIDGVEYRIPQRAGEMKKKKKKRTAGFTREEDASRRQHPANDPEGEAKIRSFIDIKCYVCSKEFESFFKLKKHFKRFHPKDKAYLSCCDRQYKRRCDLLDHIETHDKSTIHACNICNKVYKSKGCLRVHIKFYHPQDDSQQIICDECGKMCNNENLLKMHMMTHDSGGSRTFECYICKDSKTYKNIYSVRKHLRTVHAQDPKSASTVCHICSATVRISYLPNHMKQVHAEDRSRVNCERCGIWVLKSTLKVHMMKHMDMGINCKVCGKFLKSTYSLSSHMKTAHNDNYKFKCEYCDKGFHRIVKMQEHVAVRHTREFLFKCRVAGCDRQFRAEANWRIHEKKMHPEEYEKLFKPFYKRGPKELQEFEELLEGTGENL